MAALICIKSIRGAFCWLVNLANRFRRIFPIKWYQLKVYFRGVHGTPSSDSTKEHETVTAQNKYVLVHCVHESEQQHLRHTYTNRPFRHGTRVGPGGCRDTDTNTHGPWFIKQEDNASQTNKLCNARSKHRPTMQSCKTRQSLSHCSPSRNEMYGSLPSLRVRQTETSVYKSAEPNFGIRTKAVVGRTSLKLP